MPDNLQPELLSAPPSPTTSRRPSRRILGQSQSSLTEADERSPLLPRSRSHVRINASQSDLPANPRHAALLRNHSYSSMSNLLEYTALHLAAQTDRCSRRQIAITTAAPPP
jgi:hypothetical protein